MCFIFGLSEVIQRRFEVPGLKMKHADIFIDYIIFITFFNKEVKYFTCRNIIIFYKHFIALHQGQFKPFFFRKPGYDINSLLNVNRLTASGFCRIKYVKGPVQKPHVVIKHSQPLICGRYLCLQADAFFKVMQFAYFVIKFEICERNVVIDIIRRFLHRKTQGLPVKFN